MKSKEFYLSLNFSDDKTDYEKVFFDLHDQTNVHETIDLFADTGLPEENDRGLVLFNEC